MKKSRFTESRIVAILNEGDDWARGGANHAQPSKNDGIAPERMPPFQIAFTFICFPMYSAWRIARVTMVSVGFSAAPVVN
jgi:hypothetical protein